MLASIWFWLVAAMIAGYVILDGFDIGAGVLLFFIARNKAERSAVIRSIGPVWDANEVWLLAVGGTLFFAFPALYATSFSGFYLPLIMVLWLLMLRGISLEFRSHQANPLWTSFWDTIFALASTLLAIFYGAALGNVVRGVPFDSSDRFFEPLWTNFAPRGQTGILDWYTVLVGVTALMVLAMHGATWIAYKTEGELNARALRWTGGLWWGVAGLTVVLTVASFHLLPALLASFARTAWGFVFPLLAIGGIVGVAIGVRARNDALAFRASCLYLLGMLTSVVFSLYPNVLPSSTNPALNLTIANAKAADSGLKIGLIWWVIGMALALTYTSFAYRSFAGKIRSSEASHY